MRRRSRAERRIYMRTMRISGVTRRMLWWSKMGRSIINNTNTLYRTVGLDSSLVMKLRILLLENFNM